MFRSCKKFFIIFCALQLWASHAFAQDPKPTKQPVSSRKYFVLLDSYNQTQKAKRITNLETFVQFGDAAGLDKYKIVDKSLKEDHLTWSQFFNHTSTKQEIGMIIYQFENDQPVPHLHNYKKNGSPIEIRSPLIQTLTTNANGTSNPSIEYGIANLQSFIEDWNISEPSNREYNYYRSSMIVDRRISKEKTSEEVKQKFKELSAEGKFIGSFAQAEEVIAVIALMRPDFVKTLIPIQKLELLIVTNELPVSIAGQIELIGTPYESVEKFMCSVPKRYRVSEPEVQVVRNGMDPSTLLPEKWLNPINQKVDQLSLDLNDFVKGLWWSFFPKSPELIPVIVNSNGKNNIWRGESYIPKTNIQPVNDGKKGDVSDKIKNLHNFIVLWNSYDQTSRLIHFYKSSDQENIESLRITYRELTETKKHINNFKDAEEVIREISSRKKEFAEKLITIPQLTSLINTDALPDEIKDLISGEKNFEVVEKMFCQIPSNARPSKIVQNGILEIPSTFLSNYLQSLIYKASIYVNQAIGLSSANAQSTENRELSTSNNSIQPNNNLSTYPHEENLERIKNDQELATKIIKLKNFISGWNLLSQREREAAYFDISKYLKYSNDGIIGEEIKGVFKTISQDGLYIQSFEDLNTVLDLLFYTDRDLFDKLITVRELQRLIDENKLPKEIVEQIGAQDYRSVEKNICYVPQVTDQYGKIHFVREKTGTIQYAERKYIAEHFGKKSSKSETERRKMFAESFNVTIPNSDDLYYRQIMAQYGVELRNRARYFYSVESPEFFSSVKNGLQLKYLSLLFQEITAHATATTSKYDLLRVILKDNLYIDVDFKNHQRKTQLWMVIMLANDDLADILVMNDSYLGKLNGKAEYESTLLEGASYTKEARIDEVRYLIDYADVYSSYGPKEVWYRAFAKKNLKITNLDEIFTWFERALQGKFDMNVYNHESIGLIQWKLFQKADEFTKEKLLKLANPLVDKTLFEVAKVNKENGNSVILYPANATDEQKKQIDIEKAINNNDVEAIKTLLGSVSDESAKFVVAQLEKLLIQYLINRDSTDPKKIEIIKILGDDYYPMLKNQDHREVYIELVGTGTVGNREEKRERIKNLRPNGNTDLFVVLFPVKPYVDAFVHAVKAIWNLPGKVLESAILKYYSNENNAEGIVGRENDHSGLKSSDLYPPKHSPEKVVNEPQSEFEKALNDPAKLNSMFEVASEKYRKEHDATLMNEWIDGYEKFFMTVANPLIEKIISDPNHSLFLAYYAKTVDGKKWDEVVQKKQKIRRLFQVMEQLAMSDMREDLYTSKLVRKLVLHEGISANDLEQAALYAENLGYETKELVIKKLALISHGEFYKWRINHSDVSKWTLEDFSHAIQLWNKENPAYLITSEKTYEKYHLGYLPVTARFRQLCMQRLKTVDQFLGYAGTDQNTVVFSKIIVSDPNQTYENYYQKNIAGTDKDNFHSWRLAHNDLDAWTLLEFGRAIELWNKDHPTEKINSKRSYESYRVHYFPRLKQLEILCLGHGISINKFLENTQFQIQEQELRNQYENIAKSENSYDEKFKTLKAVLQKYPWMTSPELAKILGMEAKVEIVNWLVKLDSTWFDLLEPTITKENASEWIKLIQKRVIELNTYRITDDRDERLDIPNLFKDPLYHVLVGDLLEFQEFDDIKGIETNPEITKTVLQEKLIDDRFELGLPSIAIIKKILELSNKKIEDLYKPLGAMWRNEILNVYDPETDANFDEWYFTTGLKRGSNAIEHNIKNRPDLFNIQSSDDLSNDQLFQFGVGLTDAPALDFEHSSYASHYDEAKEVVDPTDVEAARLNDEENIRLWKNEMNHPLIGYLKNLLGINNNIDLPAEEEKIVGHKSTEIHTESLSTYEYPNIFVRGYYNVKNFFHKLNNGWNALKTFNSLRGGNHLKNITAAERRENRWWNQLLRSVTEQKANQTPNQPSNKNGGPKDFRDRDGPLGRQKFQRPSFMTEDSNEPVDAQHAQGLPEDGRQPQQSNSQQVAFHGGSGTSSEKNQDIDPSKGNIQDQFEQALDLLNMNYNTKNGAFVQFVQGKDLESSYLKKFREKYPNATAIIRKARVLYLEGFGSEEIVGQILLYNQRIENVKKAGLDGELKMAEFDKAVSEFQYLDQFAENHTLSKPQQDMYESLGQLFKVKTNEVKQATKKSLFDVWFGSKEKSIVSANENNNETSQPVFSNREVGLHIINVLSNIVENGTDPKTDLDHAIQSKNIKSLRKLVSELDQEKLEYEFSRAIFLGNSVYLQMLLETNKFSADQIKYALLYLRCNPVDHVLVDFRKGTFIERGPNAELVRILQSMLDPIELRKFERSKMFLSLANQEFLSIYVTEHHLYSSTDIEAYPATLRQDVVDITAHVPSYFRIKFVDTDITKEDVIFILKYTESFVKTIYSAKQIKGQNNPLTYVLSDPTSKAAKLLLEELNRAPQEYPWLSDQFTQLEGEKISEIIKNYSTDPKEIQKLDHIATMLVKVGKQIWVPKMFPESPTNAFISHRGNDADQLDASKAFTLFPTFKSNDGFVGDSKGDMDQVLQPWKYFGESKFNAPIFNNGSGTNVADEIMELSDLIASENTILFQATLNDIASATKSDLEFQTKLLAMVVAEGVYDNRYDFLKIVMADELIDPNAGLPLQVAVLFGDKKAVELLMQNKKTDPNLLDPKTSATILDGAFYIRDQASNVIVLKIFKRNPEYAVGKDVNLVLVKNRHDETLLEIANMFLFDDRLSWENEKRSLRENLGAKNDRLIASAGKTNENNVDLRNSGIWTNTPQNEERRGDEPNQLDANRKFTLFPKKQNENNLDVAKGDMDVILQPWKYSGFRFNAPMFNSGGSSDLNSKRTIFSQSSDPGYFFGLNSTEIFNFYYINNPENKLKISESDRNAYEYENLALEDALAGKDSGKVNQFIGKYSQDKANFEFSRAIMIGNSFYLKLLLENRNFNTERIKYGILFLKLHPPAIFIARDNKYYTRDSNDRLIAVLASKLPEKERDAFFESKMIASLATSESMIEYQNDASNEKYPEALQHDIAEFNSAAPMFLKKMIVKLGNSNIITIHAVLSYYESIANTLMPNGGTLPFSVPIAEMVRNPNLPICEIFLRSIENGNSYPTLVKEFLKLSDADVEKILAVYISKQKNIQKLTKLEKLLRDNEKEIVVKNVFPEEVVSKGKKDDNLEQSKKIASEEIRDNFLSSIFTWGRDKNKMETLMKEYNFDQKTLNIAIHVLFSIDGQGDLHPDNAAMIRLFYENSGLSPEEFSKLIYGFQIVQTEHFSQKAFDESKNLIVEPFKQNIDFILHVKPSDHDYISKTINNPEIKLESKNALLRQALYYKDDLQMAKIIIESSPDQMQLVVNERFMMMFKSPSSQEHNWDSIDFLMDYIDDTTITTCLKELESDDEKEWKTQLEEKLSTGKNGIRFAIENNTEKNGFSIASLKEGSWLREKAEAFQGWVDGWSERANVALGLKAANPGAASKDKPNPKVNVDYSQSGKTKVVSVTSTEAMGELRGMVEGINRLETVVEREKYFQKNKERFLELQDVLVKDRAHRVEVVKLLGSVSVVDRAGEHARQGATTEFPKFFAASMVANVATAIVDGESGVDTVIEMMKNIGSEITRNGTFAVGAAGGTAVFDTFVPLLSRKFEMEYRAKVMQAMLTRKTTYSVAEIMKRESSLMDGFLRNQFSMLAGTVLNLALYNKNLSTGEILKQATVQSTGFFLAQCVVRGILVRSLASSEILAGIEVGSKANVVIGGIVFAADLFLQGYINRGIAHVEKNMRLQDQIMKGAAEFIKGRKQTDFNYLAASLGMYWDQMIMGDVQALTYKYEQKQNDLDEDLSFIRTPDDQKVYPIVGKEQSTQEQRNQLWIEYYRTGDVVQRNARAKLEPTMASLIRTLRKTEDQYAQVEKICPKGQKQVVLNCGMPLLSLQGTMDELKDKLLSYALRTRSVTSPMEQVYLTISNTFSAAKELDATELTKVVLTIAKMGSPLQKQNLIQLLEELQTREERVTPKNYEISETQVIEGFNLELLKKYPEVDTNSRTITAVVPSSGNVNQEVSNLFLEMAYLKKCKATKKIPNLKLYVKKRKDLEQDPIFQVQKKKMNQTLQTSWMGKLLSIPSDTDHWEETLLRLRTQEYDTPVLHVLQVIPGDRLGTPYTHHQLTTPIFEQDLKKYENILECSLPTPQKPRASSTPSRASFLQ